LFFSLLFFLSKYFLPFQMAVLDWKKLPPCFEQIRWHRIVLDEPHQGLNDRSGVVPGTQYNLRYPGDGDDTVRLLTEVLVPELIAARAWQAQRM
jgi:hypothetical protein